VIGSNQGLGTHLGASIDEFKVDDRVLTSEEALKHYRAYLQCGDGLDNEEDGLVDCPSDPGCMDSLDVSEGMDCRDAVDNDGDGLVEYPSERAEHGCTWWDDPSERPQCSDGLDNDQDGDIDYPADSQCMSDSWTAEFEQPAEYCGMSAELTLVLAPLMWLYRKQRRRV
jgi:hypothetical protein